MYSSKIEFYWSIFCVILLTIVFIDFSIEKKIKKILLMFAFFMHFVFYAYVFFIYTKNNWVLNEFYSARMYYQMEFFQKKEFQNFYKEKMDKALPFVSIKYQIPAIINFYVSARVISSEDYHVTFYSHHYKDIDTLKMGMYYVKWVYDGDFKKISPHYENVEKVMFPKEIREMDVIRHYDIYKLSNFKGNVK